MVAGALAPLQAHASKKAFEQGQTGRGLAYGAGALGNVLQMTGFLPAMGAGALLNIPAAYYEAEDLLKPPGALPAGNQ
jgi:ABC-type sugar transport system permease subunit